MDSDFLFMVSDYPFTDSGFVLFPFSDMNLSGVGYRFLRKLLVIHCHYTTSTTVHEKWKLY